MLDSTARVTIWVTAFIVAVLIHVLQARSRKAQQKARFDEAVRASQDMERYFPELPREDE